MKLGEADIDAIEIGNEVTQDEEWYQPPHHLSNYPRFYIFHGEASRFLRLAYSSFCRVSRNCSAEDANGLFKGQNESGETQSFGLPYRVKNLGQVH
jgi:hypothetical protein